MRLIKYNGYIFFLGIFFIFLLKSRPVQAYGLGYSLGGSFQSFSYNSTKESFEDSQFGFDTSILGTFLPHKRILLIPELGFSYYLNFYSPYIGVKAGFVLHPSYLPFIGVTAREQFYNQMLNKSNEFSTTLYFSMGSELFRNTNNQFWFFFDYLILQSETKTINSSRFTLSLAYIYNLH